MVKRTLGIMIVIIATLTGACWGQSRSDMQREQYLRLHVIANSDSQEDQALKLKVRDAVVRHCRQEFTAVADAREARRLAEQNIPSLQAVARQVIKEQGYDYSVQVLVGESEFPTRRYGDLELPQGRYQAVRIVIGQGMGQNWWCVLFPPLCLVSDSEQGIMTAPPENAEVKFKVLEVMQGLCSKD
ncbi:MAG: stage II sporulation protein R [Syntrophomonadaceae bacterium]